ncbi:unnamed protein product, partial [Brassica oleracea]
EHNFHAPSSKQIEGGAGSLVPRHEDKLLLILCLIHSFTKGNLLLCIVHLMVPHNQRYW